MKSRMRMNYRVNDNPTSGHLDGLSIPPPAENFLNSLKIKYECQGLAWVEREGGGAGLWAQVVELTDA